VGVGGFLRWEGRVLLVQRGRDPGRGRWTFPGGFLEEDEAPDAGLVREVREETGLRVAVDGLVAVRHAQTDSEQNVYCVYRLNLVGPLDELMEAGDGDEVERVVWIEPDRLSTLGDVGGVTRWIIEHAGDSGRALRPLRSGFPVIPAHRWSVLMAATPPDQSP
jgi:ADP-ribose pyrophosphatase YjhB (NUDIX family)